MGNPIKAAGIGGLKSDQVISRHRGTINNELTEANKLIVHVGSNDVANEVPPEKIANNVESAGIEVVLVNSKVKAVIN